MKRPIYRPRHNVSGRIRSAALKENSRLFYPIRGRTELDVRHKVRTHVEERVYVEVTDNVADMLSALLQEQ